MQTADPGMSFVALGLLSDLSISIIIHLFCAEYEFDISWPEVLADLMSPILPT
jgi:hypothetical protein